MTEYVAVLQFAENSQTYQGLSDLGSSAAASEITASALVERDADGKLTVPEAGDNKAGGGFTTGSLIGLLVGALGGPLGMLLGWGVGATTGGLVDADRDDDQDSALLALSSLIPAGRNALVLETKEDTPDLLDQFAAANNAVITRRPLDEVLSELEAQEDAAQAAQDAADQTLRDQKKAERKENREERIAKLKAKFHKN